LTYGFDGTVRIWDLEDPAADPVVLSHGDGEVINYVDFSENGKWVISGTDQNIYVWQWKFEDVANLACRLVGRNLTVDEWAKYYGNKDGYRKTCDEWP
jgi:WD40 repeat protein